MSGNLEEVVRADAAALLSDEKRWTLGAWARNATGSRCDPLSPGACRWCAVGALEVCAFRMLGDQVRARVLARRAASLIAPGPGGLVYINERYGFEVVRSMLEGKQASIGGPTASIYARDTFGPFARSN